MNETTHPDVPEFPGYRVGRDGSLWTLRSHSAKKSGCWERRDTQPNTNDGYTVVALRRDGRTLFRLLHRIVLEAFVGPCPEGMEARHLDGDPTNNALDNLAWGTPQDNADDRKRHGTVPMGERHVCAKLTESQARHVIPMRREGLSDRDIGDFLGVSPTTVHRIRTGRNWRHLDARRAA